MQDQQKCPGHDPGDQSWHSSPTQETVHIIDGMAMVQVTKSGGATTFGDMASKYVLIPGL